MGFGFECITIVSFDCSGSDSIFASSNIIFFGFDYFEDDFNSFIFFVLEIIETYQTGMNCDTNTITI
jgi:hypothetical protein